jgi:malate/lactate dehydrogenase
VVTNPVDEMTYLVLEEAGVQLQPGDGYGWGAGHFAVHVLPRRAVGIPPREVSAMVLGTHGDDMVPLVDWSRAGDSLPAEAAGSGMEEVVERTRDGGGDSLSHEDGQRLLPPRSRSVMASRCSATPAGPTGLGLPDGSTVSGIFLSPRGRPR